VDAYFSAGPDKLTDLFWHFNVFQVYAGFFGHVAANVVAWHLGMRSNALLSASGVYAVDKMGQRWSCVGLR